MSNEKSRMQIALEANRDKIAKWIKENIAPKLERTAFVDFGDYFSYGIRTTKKHHLRVNASGSIAYAHLFGNRMNNWYAVDDGFTNASTIEAIINNWGYIKETLLAEVKRQNEVMNFTV